MTRKGCLRTSAVLGVLSVVILVAAGLFIRTLITPYQGYTNEIFIDLERGTGTFTLAQMLEEEGVIQSRYAFLLWRALHPGASLQAGEYHFDKPLTPGEVFDRFRRGRIYYEEIVVPEGSNIYNIADAMGSLRYIKPEDFKRAASDPHLIRDLDPQAPNLEGYLFPSTYRIMRRTTAEDLCREMTLQFRRQWRVLAGNRTDIDIHRIVTLASLVEKETGSAAERPLIAAVFQNRLAKNMALQCDPTVIYAALRKNLYRGTIYRSDLASNDPYNTYTHTGLPPGPIANPGVDSLKAALDPPKADYLYFVAKPGSQGVHTFSATLGEHQVAVQAYRKSP